MHHDTPTLASAAAACATRLNEGGIEEHGLTSNSSQQPWWRQEGAASQPAYPFIKDVNNHIFNGSNRTWGMAWQAGENLIAYSTSA